MRDRFALFGPIHNINNREAPNDITYNFAPTINLIEKAIPFIYLR